MASTRQLEHQWIVAACGYEVHNESPISDDAFDALAVELWKRRAELSAPFCHLTLGTWPAPPGEPGENPLKTASGVRWDRGLGLLFALDKPA